jgi:hypothetical protein
MLHIAMSNGSMDWHKFPKSRTSIRILQPKTLDSIKCHTFPGLGGKSLDILLHYSPLQLFFAPNVLTEMSAHTNSYIVIQARLVHASACQSDLHKFKSTWRLAKGCFTPTSLAPTGRLQRYWPGPAYQPIQFCHCWMSSAQQPATFQVVSCSSIEQECTATSWSAPPRRSLLYFVEARPSNIMAGAWGAAGPAPDIHCQPAGRTMKIYATTLRH